MIIPPDQLRPETLTALLEEFVSRDGTDNGYQLAMEIKVEKVRRQLEKGEAVIVFEPDSQSCNIVSRQALKEAGL